MWYSRTTKRSFKASKREAESKLSHVYADLQQADLRPDVPKKGSPC